MKITKNIKTVARGAAKTANRAAKSVVSASRVSFQKVKSVQEAILEHHIDGATAWLGTKINGKIVTQLIDQADEIGKAKLTKPHDKVLVVTASKLFAWPLTGLHGDVYARMHSPKTEVRGSLAVLKKNYGESRVKVVSLKDALAMAAKIKTDAGCLKLLKSATA